MAVQMGAVMVGQIAAFTPDYMKAKIAAARMFKLFDRIPGIRSDSDEGLQVLVSLSMIHILSYQQGNSNIDQHMTYIFMFLGKNERSC